MEKSLNLEQNNEQVFESVSNIKKAKNKFIAIEIRLFLSIIMKT